MILPAHDHRYLEGVGNDQLAALLLEVASQLHVERQHRIALVSLLKRKRLVDTAELDALTTDDAVLDQGRAELDRNLRRLLRIMTETGDPRGPLRTEAGDAKHG